MVVKDEKLEKVDMQIRKIKVRLPKYMKSLCDKIYKQFGSYDNILNKSVKHYVETHNLDSDEKEPKDKNDKGWSITFNLDIETSKKMDKMIPNRFLSIKDATLISLVLYLNSLTENGVSI